MARTLLLLAFVLFISGPVILLLTGSFAIGALIFSGGVVLLGVRSLVENHDRAVGWALILVGSLAAVADLARLLLIAGSSG